MKKIFLHNLLALVFITFSATNAQWTKTSFSGHGIINEIISIDDVLFVATGSDGIFRSTDNGTTWEEVNNGLPAYIEGVDFLHIGNRIWLLIQYAGVYYSENNGAEWTPDLAGFQGSEYFRQLAGNSEDLFVATDMGVYYKKPDGENWVGANDGLTDLDVRSIFLNGNDLFCGTYADGIFKTSINSINWVNVNNGINSGDYALDFDATSSKIFAATSGGIYSSANAGQNWTPVPNDAGTATNVIEDIEIVGNSVFATVGSGEGGIAYSSDLGANWSMENQGLPNYPYSSSLEISSSKIFLGVNLNGELWERNLSEFVTDVEDEENTFPKEFRLSQNYPNPFSKGSGGNSSTVISYQLPKSEFVSLKVYDVLGNEIIELVNKEQSAGNYNVNFSANAELAAGVYFYRLQAGNFVQTKKMMLIK